MFKTYGDEPDEEEWALAAKKCLMYFYRRDYTGDKKAFDDTIYTERFAELASEEMWELCDAYFIWVEE